MSDWRTPADRARERNELAGDVEAFLARGGKIQQVGIIRRTLDDVKQIDMAVYASRQAAKIAAKAAKNHKPEKPMTAKIPEPAPARAIMSDWITAILMREVEDIQANMPPGLDRLELVLALIERIEARTDEAIPVSKAPAAKPAIANVNANPEWPRREEIAKLAKEHGLTPNWLGTKLGWPGGAANHYLAGRNNPTPERARMLEALVEQTVAELENKA